MFVALIGIALTSCGNKAERLEKEIEKKSEELILLEKEYAETDDEAKAERLEKKIEKLVDELEELEEEYSEAISDEDEIAEIGD